MYWGINLKFIAYLMLASFLFLAGWTINGWRYEARISKDIQKMIVTERNLQKELDIQRGKYNAEIRSLNAKHNGIIEQLRKRPSRSSTVTENGQACDGSKLPREDAEFLIGEATRADQVVAQLNFCYANYEKARLALEK